MKSSKKSDWLGVESRDPPIPVITGLHFKQARNAIGDGNKKTNQFSGGGSGGSAGKIHDHESHQVGAHLDTLLEIVLSQTCLSVQQRLVYRHVTVVGVVTGGLYQLP